jgi:hypothetical protein
MPSITTFTSTTSVFVWSIDLLGAMPVPTANIHGSQMLPILHDPMSTYDYVLVDSAYAGEHFKDLLNPGGGVRFNSRE